MEIRETLDDRGNELTSELIDVSERLQHAKDEVADARRRRRRQRKQTRHDDDDEDEDQDDDDDDAHRTEENGKVDEGDRVLGALLDTIHDGEDRHRWNPRHGRGGRRHHEGHDAATDADAEDDDGAPTEDANPTSSPSRQNRPKRWESSEALAARLDELIRLEEDDARRKDENARSSRRLTGAS